MDLRLLRKIVLDIFWNSCKMVYMMRKQVKQNMKKLQKALFYSNKYSVIILTILLLFCIMVLSVVIINQI